MKTTSRRFAASLAGCLCLLGAVKAWAQPTEPLLTAQATGGHDVQPSDSVALVALGALAALIILSLFSVGESAPGADSLVRSLMRGRGEDDLYVRVQLKSPGGNEPPATAFLRSLDQHHATLLVPKPWPIEAPVILCTRIGTQHAKKILHATVKRCRSLTGETPWFLLRLDLGQERGDKAQSLELLQELG